MLRPIDFIYLKVTLRSRSGSSGSPAMPRPAEWIIQRRSLIDDRKTGEKREDARTRKKRK